MCNIGEMRELEPIPIYDFLARQYFRTIYDRTSNKQII